MEEHGSGGRDTGRTFRLDGAGSGKVGASASTLMRSNSMNSGGSLQRRLYSSLVMDGVPAGQNVGSSSQSARTWKYFRNITFACGHRDSRLPPSWKYAQAVLYFWERVRAAWKVYNAYTCIRFIR